MGKRIFFTWALTTVLSLLSAKQSSGSFLSSLQFTRDALMDFSRGSQRTVDITLASKITTKTVNKTYKMTRSSPNLYSSKYKLVEVKGIFKKTSNDTINVLFANKFVKVGGGREGRKKKREWETSVLVRPLLNHFTVRNRKFCWGKAT